ncbi:hypothetical protein [Pseudaquabacterium pictum]|uniref:Lysozyme inhibitor LprI N-terminal domain-containing protein n=1 Tax=Pseudaquabacterium pictum TaxID=2315236 RepID=A0A480AJW5_9BURK|nr:hypothetical protein [Rubrivivax pictus]GCL61000.1 hypothetical protein AQPW35_00810 [Rubrivivax pictus]
MMFTRTCRALLTVLLAALAAAAAAQAAEPTPQDRRAAQCVAALEASADDLVRQVKAGKETARKPLLDRLTQGAAFVGDSYLHGNANEDQARALVDQAEAAQRALSPAELAARQTACAGEANRLLANANALQRAVIKRLARKRMDKLLGA